MEHPKIEQLWLTEQPQSSNKRSYTRLEFSLQQEEQLIEFVKANPPLYNPKDPQFKNKMYRDCLWNQIGEQFDKPGRDCNKKWVNIRDIYIKSKGKRLGTGIAAEFKRRRNELMAFLDESVAVNKKRPNINIVKSGDEDDITDNYDANTTIFDETLPSKRRRNSSNDDQMKIFENITHSIKGNNSKRNEVIQKMLNDPRPEAELVLFFSSICKTVSKFSPLEQAKIKMKISQMVSETELAHLERMEKML